MTRALRSAIAFALCASLLGCTIHPIRLDDIADAHYDETKPMEVKSEACGFLLLFPFIPFRYKSHLIRVEQGLEGKAVNTVHTNVRVQERWMWLLFGTLVCTELSATAYPKLP